MTRDEAETLERTGEIAGRFYDMLVERDATIDKLRAEIAELHAALHPAPQDGGEPTREKFCNCGALEASLAGHKPWCAFVEAVRGRSQDGGLVESSEWSASHPIESGEVTDAERVRPATAKELHQELMDAWDSLSARALTQRKG